jgi:hypothetical protein
MHQAKLALLAIILGMSPHHSNLGKSENGKPAKYLQEREVTPKLTVEEGSTVEDTSG